jgi:hypothetical protein
VTCLSMAINGASRMKVDSSFHFLFVPPKYDGAEVALPWTEILNKKFHSHILSHVTKRILFRTPSYVNIKCQNYRGPDHVTGQPGHSMPQNQWGILHVPELEQENKNR